MKKVNNQNFVNSLASSHLAAQREISILRRYHHDNIIRLIGYCRPTNTSQLSSELCLVYEFAHLGGLNSILEDDCKAKKLPWQYRLNILEGIGKALSYLHTNGVFHRDIKAANVALMSDCTPKLIDYGMANHRRAEGAIPDSMMYSAVGVRHGTSRYMCPHYSRTSISYDHKCEMFSLGILVFELFSGKLQGYLKDGINNFLENDIDSNEGLTGDLRAGDWPDGCVKDLTQLGRDCVARYDKGRLDNMSEFLRLLNIIRNKYHVSSQLDKFHEEKINNLLAEKEILSIEEDIKSMQDAQEKHYEPEAIPEVFCASCANNVPAWKGIECSNTANPHFICTGTGGCFSDMVTSQSEDHGDFVNNNSQMVCPQCIAFLPKIVSTFCISTVGKQTDEAALIAYISAREEVARRKCLKDVEKLRLQEADELELKEESAIGDPELRMKAGARRHRRHIIERILTLRCPHCDFPWFDFEKCFALRHDDNVCGRYFCGWCLEKCKDSQQCDDHVKSCSENPHKGRRDVRGKKNREEEFKDVHDKRKRFLVLQYLRDHVPTETEKEEVKMLLTKDTDMNLDD